MKECNAEDEQKAMINTKDNILPSVDHIEPGISEQIHHLCFSFQEQPLVSIIIPNKDHISDLDRTIHSVIEKTTWKNLEFIVIENNSTNADTFEYYPKNTKGISYCFCYQLLGRFQLFKN